MSTGTTPKPVKWQTYDRDVTNLRRRAYNHGRTIRDQVHAEALKMLATHRPEVVVAHLALAVRAEAA